MNRKTAIALADVVATIGLTGFAITAAIQGEWGWFWANIAALAIGLPYLRRRVDQLKRPVIVEGNPYENVGEPHVLGEGGLDDCSIWEEL